MNLNDFISVQRQKLTVNNYSSRMRNQIESNLNRLEEIKKHLDVNAYKLVFIGNTGSGKTTTICNYLNLIEDIEIGDKFHGMQLFDVASGKTTAFEVHYQRADKTGFRIIPMNFYDQRQHIQDYCEYIWNLAFSITEESDDASKSKTKSDNNIENGRIVRNMLEFETDTAFQEYVQEHYEKTQWKQFFEAMFIKSRIQFRNCTELFFSEEEDVKHWLKKEFSKINKGKNPDVAIPERVDVLLNPDDLDYDMPEK